MTRQFFILLLIIMTSLCGPAEISARRPKRLTAAIEDLDRELSRKDEYIVRKHQTIDSLKHEASRPRKGRAKRLRDVGGAYQGFNNDSSAVFFKLAYNQAIEEKDSGEELASLLGYAATLPKAGLFTDALNALDTINLSGRSRLDSLRFYQVRSRIYLDASRYSPLAPRKAEYQKLAIDDLHVLRDLLPSGSIGHRMVAAQENLLLGKETIAVGDLNEVFDHLTPDDPFYAIVANMLATYFADKEGKDDEYLYYLTLSATADTRNANGETASLVKLGNEMFRHGDYDHAFSYLSSSGESLASSGSRLLITEVAPPLAVFSNVMRKREHDRAVTLAFILIGVAIVLIVSATYIYKIHRRSTRQSTDNAKLQTSVQMRDQYINQLLEICSVYVESMEDYNRLVGRKLKANQGQDLLKTVESGRILQEQAEKFFKVFDNAVLSIYPDFVSEVNQLLLPDKQVSLPSAGRLSPELRILAFMRLGVTDSTRLSKFLSLSLNTIYTYRNRMKSRAINRENFENQVMNIGKMR